MGLFRGSCENDITDLLTVSVLPRGFPIGIFCGSTENDSKSVLSFSQLPRRSPFQNIEGTVDKCSYVNIVKICIGSKFWDEYISSLINWKEAAIIANVLVLHNAV